LGLAGHPRRYAEVVANSSLGTLMPVQQIITIAAIVTISAQMVFVFNLGWSARRGAPSSSNPWHATTLEWNESNPRVKVVRGPYEYLADADEPDFLSQSGSV